MGGDAVVEVGSQRAYARRKGITHRAVQKAVAAGRIPVLPDGRLDFCACDVAWGRNARRRPNGHAGGNGATGGPQGLAAVQAQLVALRVERERWLLERERGEWVRADEVARAWFQAAQRTRDGILIIPHRIAHELHMVDARVVERTLARALRTVLSAAAHGEALPEHDVPGLKGKG